MSPKASAEQHSCPAMGRWGRQMTPNPPANRPRRIRDLNDAFRSTFTGGIVTLTPGVRALGPAQRQHIIEKVRRFSDFTSDANGQAEHDYGAFSVDNADFCWRIGYYNRTLDGYSNDPSDPDLTIRIFTIMISED